MPPCPGEKVSGADILKAAVVGSLTAGVGSKLGGALGKLRTTCRNSFTATTRVLMADGTLKEIRRVAFGDRVRATDARTGKSSARTVTNLIHHAGAHSMVALTLVAGGTIHATADHPVYDGERKLRRRKGAAPRQRASARRRLSRHGGCGDRLHGRPDGLQPDGRRRPHVLRVRRHGHDVLVHNCGGGEQIGYNSDELSTAAFQAREAAGFPSGRNVAVARVAGRDALVVGFSKGSGYHSEQHILDKLADEGVPAGAITHLFSERQPCGICGPKLSSLAPDAKITYSVPWGTDPAERAGANDLLKSLIQQARGR